MSCATSHPAFSGQVIELDEFNGMHFLNVTVNGIPTKLLIDTGASKSLLDITQTEKFGFQYSSLKESQYIGLGGLLDIYVTYEYEVEEFFIPFLGSDLSEVRNYFLLDGIEIAGVLGADFLERKKATIDFKTNKLYLK